MPVRVSIVEDDRITRESLAILVADEPGLELVAVYHDGESAVAGVPRSPPDVVIVDMGLSPAGSGRLDGAGCVAALRKLLPDLRALMLTVYDDHDVIVRALRAGASGYVLKRSPPDEILAAIKVISQGGAPLSMLVAMQIVNAFHDPEPSGGSAAQPPPDELQDLSPQEREILALIAKGAELREIATRTGLPLLTVRAFVHTICAKLGVPNRTQAAIKYTQIRDRARQP